MSSFIVTNRETIDHTFSISREDVIDMMIDKAPKSDPFDRETLEKLKDIELGWEFQGELDRNYDLAYEAQQFVSSSDSVEDEWTVEHE